MKHLAAASTILLIAACGGGDSGPGDEALGHPVSRDANTLIWVVVDDLGIDYLGPYGFKGGTTPHLDRLAEQGVVFTDHITACTGVNGSLASLLTGQQASAHGVGSLTHRGQTALASSRTSLAEVLSAAGWNCLAAVSKPQLAADISGLDQGFDLWAAPGLHEGTFRTSEQVVLGFGPEVRQTLEADEPLFVLLHLSDTANLKGKAGAASVPFLETHLGPFRATHPLVAAALDRAQEDPAAGAEDLEKALRRGRGDPAHTALQVAKYSARVSAVDAALGQLLDWVEQAGRLDRATVVVTATRGPRLQPSVPGAPTFSPELVRTPLVVRFPGAAPIGRVESLVRSIDLAPSLAESLGVSWPDTEGLSWLPSIESGEPDMDRLAFCESAALDRRAVLDARFSVEENRIAGIVDYRRSGDRVLGQELDEGELWNVGRLVAALNERRMPSQVVLDLNGVELDTRWNFTSGFAGAARIESGAHSRATQISGLSGSAQLGSDDTRLVAQSSERELPLRLQLNWGEGAIPKLTVGETPLESSLLPRLPRKDAPEWVRDANGKPAPADAVLEHQGGTWWKLHAGTGSQHVGQETTLLVALYPPSSLDQVLEWSAGAELEVRHPAGRQDMLLVTGSAPCVLQLEKKPSQEFALAIEIDGRVLQGERIRVRDRAFGIANGIDLYIPDWVPGVTDDLLADPQVELDPGTLRLRRQGPNIGADERRTLSPEQLSFIQHLGGAE